MRGGGRPAPAGLPGGIGGPPGPGRLGMAGAGRPLAGGTGGARDAPPIPPIPPIGAGFMGCTPLLEPPGEGGDNLPSHNLFNASQSKAKAPPAHPTEHAHASTSDAVQFTKRWKLLKSDHTWDCYQLKRLANHF